VIHRDGEGSAIEGKNSVVFLLPAAPVNCSLLMTFCCRSQVHPLRNSQILCSSDIQAVNWYGSGDFKTKNNDYLLYHGSKSGPPNNLGCADVQPSSDPYWRWQVGKSYGIFVMRAENRDVA
jgi:hypothetical protein